MMNQGFVLHIADACLVVINWNFQPSRSASRLNAQIVARESCSKPLMIPYPI